MTTPKSFSRILVVSGLMGSLLLTSCGRDKNDPGNEYMPDMYVSQAYEPLTQVKANPFNEGGINMRKPVMGTVARGQLSYYYPYKKEEYDLALKNIKMPVEIARTPENLEEGKYKYEIYCLPCHGEQGLGDGPVSAKYPKGNIPSYTSQRIKELAEGGMYHSITYGKNFMGPYGTVLTPEERWKVIQYVQHLRDSGSSSDTPSDSTASTTPADSTKK